MISTPLSPHPPLCRAWCGPLPPACANARVRRLTPQEIAAGKGGYRIVPDADSRGFYVVDLKEIARRPRWSLRSVVHHELLPGHMVQLPIEAQTPPHPVRALYSGGYVEGWARSEEHTSELQSLMRISYAVFCL